MGNGKSDKAVRQLEAARGLARDLAGKLDLNASLRLWDGSLTPLGSNVTGPFEISIADAGVIGSLLRWPTLDNFIRHYVDKGIDFSGGTLIDLGSQLNRGGRSVKLKGRDALKLARQLYPFLTARSEVADGDQGFEGEITGRRRKTADNKDFIQFHYDLSNDFYALFLDPEMVYSCAYYTNWNNDVAQAQRDKLEMICRKLRLKPGERFLDIGCGWGGLICHAAKTYGVTAHGITLSEEQLAFAKEKIKRLGLEDKVTVELKDYSMMLGQFDKIASIGMFEHVGIANYPTYFGTIHRLLKPHGLYLHHAIVRRAKRDDKAFRRRSREYIALTRYIFPGAEVDHIGMSVSNLDRYGFEVRDVEGWREHYAQTCRLWHDRLLANREAAEKEVGIIRTRLWLAYLAGVALGFEGKSMGIYQTLAVRRDRGPRERDGLPPTRADLYR